MNKNIMDRKIAVGTSIVNAQYDLEIGEKYILYLALASVNQRIATSLDEGCSVSIEDFALIRGRNEDGVIFPQRSDHAREELSKSIKTLFKKSIKLYTEGGVLEEHRWITSYRDVDSEGKVHFLWNPSMVKHLADLKTYANLLTSSLVGVKGKYSNRVLELVSQERSRGRTSGTTYVELEKFLSMIEAGETYRDFKYLNKYVLKPSVKELKDKGIVDIDVKLRRVGRVVVGFELEWSF